MKERLSALYEKEGTKKLLASLVSILIGLLVGGLTGVLVGFLKYRFNIHEVVSTIMNSPKFYV